MEFVLVSGKPRFIDAPSPCKQLSLQPQITLYHNTLQDILHDNGDFIEKLSPRNRFVSFLAAIICQLTFLRLITNLSVHSYRYTIQCNAGIQAQTRKST